MKLFLNSEEKMSEKSTYREYDVVNVEDLADKTELTNLLLEMKGESFLYALSFESLRISVSQMNKLYEVLEAAHIELIFLNETTDFSLYLRKICEIEGKNIRYRTNKGLLRAKEKGIVGGRPSISEQQKELIYKLYHIQKLSLREIATQCNVSLGTAYKYAKNS